VRGSWAPSSGSAASLLAGNDPARGKKRALLRSTDFSESNSRAPSEASEASKLEGGTMRVSVFKVH